MVMYCVSEFVLFNTNIKCGISRFIRAQTLRPILKLS